MGSARTQQPPYHRVLGSEYLCTSCGNWTDAIDDATGWCLDCSPIAQQSQLEGWLKKYADELEYYMVHGNTLYEAIDKIHIDNATHCIVCGGLITRGRKPRVFCRKTSECRKMSRRYVYLYTDRGMSKAEALARVTASL